MIRWVDIMRMWLRYNDGVPIKHNWEKLCAALEKLMTVLFNKRMAHQALVNKDRLAYRKLVKAFNDVLDEAWGEGETIAVDIIIEEKITVKSLCANLQFGIVNEDIKAQNVEQAILYATIRWVEIMRMWLNFNIAHIFPDFDITHVPRHHVIHFRACRKLKERLIKFWRYLWGKDEGCDDETLSEKDKQSYQKLVERFNQVQNTMSTYIWKAIVVGRFPVKKILILQEINEKSLYAELPYRQLIKQVSCCSLIQWLSM